MAKSAYQPPMATLALAVATAIWGSTFFLIKGVAGRMAVADILAMRFILAALLMLPLFVRSLLKLPVQQWWRGLVLGLIYGVAQLLQTYGLAQISASVSGFVTGLYVVFTPLLSTLLLRQRLPRTTWVAALLAMVGLAVLSLNGFEISGGVYLTLVSAVLYALHIVCLGKWSRVEDAFAMATVQMLVIALVCFLATLPDGLRLPPDRSAWLIVLYLAWFAGAGVLLIQTWAQAQLSATRAAIIMTLEPVFAAGFAVTFGEDSLTWRMLLGGVLVVIAMYLIELAPRSQVSVVDS